MGKASRKTFKEITGKKADIKYDGDMNALVKKIEKKWNGYTVVFPMAKNSLHSLEKKLISITPIPCIIYDNKIDKRIKIPTADLLIFTSPLNVKAYLAQKQIKKKQSVIAIGYTTAKEIERVLDRDIPFPSKPSEKALFKLTKKILTD